MQLYKTKGRVLYHTRKKETAPPPQKVKCNNRKRISITNTVLNSNKISFLSAFFVLMTGSQPFTAALNLINR